MKEVNGLPVYEENDICALDEYSAAMAQKVHEKVEAAKYNDGEVKGDIADLEENDIEQDKQLTQLQQEYTELKENLDNVLPSGQASGEDITINESAKYPCKIEVEGNSWQETREGYNLLNVDKEFTVTGAGNTIELALEAGPYTIKFDDVETSDSNVTSYVCLLSLDNTAVAYVHITKTDKKKTFNLSSAINKFRIWSADSDSESIGVTTTYKNLMLYAGTEDKEYEEYGASPSTKYPSDLEAVGDSGSLKVTVSNKNLCYESRVQNSDNIRFYFNPRLLTKTFTISFIVDADLNLNSLYLTGVNENFRVAQITAVANTKAVQTITLTDEIYNELKNVKAPYFQLYKSNAGFTEVKEAIIVNSTDTSATYIAHKEQNAIFPFSEGQRLLKNCKLGDTEIIQNRKRIVLDGTENWVFGNKLTKTINFLLNNFSGYANTGSNSANAICTHFKGKENGADIDEACFWFNGTGGFRIRIEIDELADVSTNEKCVESFKSYLAQQYSTGTPVELEYELAEPETVAYTETQKTAKAEIDKLKTYKGVTYITTDSKAILDVSYKKDLEILINNLSNSEVTN